MRPYTCAGGREGWMSTKLLFFLKRSGCRPRWARHSAKSKCRARPLPLPDVPLLKGALGAAPVARGVDETHLDSDPCFSRSRSCCEGPRILLGKPSGAEAEIAKVGQKRGGRWCEARRVFSDQLYVMRQTRSGVEMDFRAASIHLDACMER